MRMGGIRGPSDPTHEPTRADRSLQTTEDSVGAGIADTGRASAGMPAVPASASSAANAPREDLFPPPRRHASLLSRTFMGIGGVLLILIGIALAVLPIVPGFPVVAVGVLMLVAAHEPSRRLVNRGVSHLPRSAVTALRRVLVQGSGRASK